MLLILMWNTIRQLAQYSYSHRAVTEPYFKGLVQNNALGQTGGDVQNAVISDVYYSPDSVLGQIQFHHLEHGSCESGLSCRRTDRTPLCRTALEYKPELPIDGHLNVLSRNTAFRHKREMLRSWAVLVMIAEIHLDQFLCGDSPLRADNPCCD